MAICELLEAKEYWIWLLSIFYTLVAVVLIVFGVISIETTGDLLTEVDLVAPAMAATVVAFLLLLVAGLGFYLGRKVYYMENVKDVVYPGGIFILGSAFLNLVLIASGIALLRYRRFLQQVADNEFNSIGERILTYQLAVFEECCSPDAADPELCANNGFLFPCIADEELYNEFLDFIGEGTCSYLETGGITSRTDPAGCSGQQIPAFISAFSGYLYGQMTILGAVNISLGLILMVMTVSIGLSMRNLAGYSSTRDRDKSLAAHNKDLGVELTTNFDYEEPSS